MRLVDCLTSALRRARRIPRARVLACVLVLAATSLAAQDRSWGREGYFATPIREGLPEQRTGFMFCRLLYTSVIREPMGYGWSTDYPRSDRNFMTRLTQLTTAGISQW